MDVYLFFLFYVVELLCQSSVLEGEEGVLDASLLLEPLLLLRCIQGLLTNYESYN